MSISDCNIDIVGVETPVDPGLIVNADGDLQTVDRKSHSELSLITHLLRDILLQLEMINGV